MPDRLFYVIVGPDGHPCDIDGVPVSANPGLVPHLCPTAIHAADLRKTWKLDPNQYHIVPRFVVDPDAVCNLRSSLHKMHRRAQAAEGRLIQAARSRPLGWRALLYFEALRRWSRNNPSAPPPPPDLERHRLALAMAVQALQNAIRDPKLLQTLSPSSALYLSCAEDLCSSPGSPNFSLLYPIKGETRAPATPPCSSLPSSSSSAPSSSTSSESSSPSPSPLPLAPTLHLIHPPSTLL